LPPQAAIIKPTHPRNTNILSFDVTIVAPEKSLST
jgi:hypothetical protein